MTDGLLDKKELINTHSHTYTYSVYGMQALVRLFDELIRWREKKYTHTRTDRSVWNAVLKKIL